MSSLLIHYILDHVSLVQPSYTGIRQGIYRSSWFIFILGLSLSGWGCQDPYRTSINPDDFNDPSISSSENSISPPINDQGTEGNEGNEGNEEDQEELPSPPHPQTQDFLPEGYFIASQSYANVMRTVQFFQEDPNGHLQGFDLDNQQSTGMEEESCGIQDRISPEGEEGIDNQLGVLWKTLQPIVGEAVEALLYNAVNDGRLLMMVELSNVDDLYDDDSVGLAFFRGRANPIIGAQGTIVPNQTFQVDQSFPSSFFDQVRIEEGWIEAGPVEFAIPIEIFDANFEFRVRQGRVRFQIKEDGSFSGVMGGRVALREVLDQLLNSNAANEARLVQPLFENNADLGYQDGNCTEISVAFGFTGTPAFVLRQSSDP